MIDLISQLKDQLDHLKQESSHTEADHEESIGVLKAKISHLERELKKEKNSKENLEKEIDKKKFKETIQVGEMKMQLKQLQYNLQSKS